MSAEAHAHSEEQPKPANAGETPKPAHKEPTKPAPAEDKKAAAPDKPHHTPAAPATGERPIVAAYKSVKNGLTSSASQVVATTSAFGGWLRKVFRAGELEPVEQVNIPKTLPYTAGHIIDGTALCVPRRIVEGAEPVAAATLAIGRTLAIPFSPLHNLAHPIEAAKKPARIITSTLMAAKNAIMAIPRTAHEFADRSIARSIEQISTQLRRIPLISSLIATPTTWISRKVADIVGSIKNGVDWITSPIDHIHNATAPGGAAAAATAPTATHAHQ